MFRTQQNAFDELVVKATDENYTSENWGDIMIVCDKVLDTENGARDAIQAVIKRLGHRNANVQLYTLELTNALSQNCGIKLHRELASRSFTDALLRLAGERNTHQKVKAKILERMGDWAEMFSGNTELGIMEGAYMKLKAQNPHLQPPSQPPKTLITESDRRREEEELQMALTLSIQEKDKSKVTPQANNQGRVQPSSSTQQSEPVAAQPVPSGTTAATVSRVRGLYDFNPSEPGELQFRKGDIISVVASVYKDWWKGSLHGQTGIFPLNYVEKLQDPTGEELEREAHMEAEVFAEIKNVEKLLALLSTSAESGRGDVRDNEEITTLYHSTLAIRPKLIELIGKYSQKKDDFTQLNEKFIKARRDYEALLEASMSQPPQQYPAYGGPTPHYGGGYGRQYSPEQAGGQPPSGYTQPYHRPGPSEAAYPPQNGQQQPFYFVPPDQRQTQQQGYPPHPADPSASTDDLYSGPPARQNAVQRPVSVAYDPRTGSVPGGHGGHGGGPQELATSAYDSPVTATYPQHAPPATANASSPPPPQAQQSTSYPSDPYGPTPSAAAGSQRPTSPYAQPAAQSNAQPQNPNAFYSLPSQQQSTAAQPSDPYSWPTQQQATPAPTSSSPVQTNHDAPAQAGYPPNSTQPSQLQTGYPNQSGYPPSGNYTAYQAYQPNATQRWSTVPPGATQGQAPA